MIFPTEEDRRMTFLLRRAANALVDGRDPFSTAFLVENDVTYDECMEMSDAIATAIFLLLSMRKGARA